MINSDKTSSRLHQQIEVLAYLDQLKGVLRRTHPIGMKRRENSAEHSWQVALSALFLSEHSNEPIDVLKVITMLLLHDIVEIETGDTFHYDKDSNESLAAQELASARKILGELPPEQGGKFLEHWIEFEERKTPEAKFAHAIDRLQAFISNPRNNGGTWVEHKLSKELLLNKNGHAQEGSQPIWDYICEQIDAAAENGFLS